MRIRGRVLPSAAAHCCREMSSTAAAELAPLAAEQPGDALASVSEGGLLGLAEVADASMAAKRVRSTKLEMKQKAVRAAMERQSALEAEFNALQQERATRNLLARERKRLECLQAKLPVAEAEFVQAMEELQQLEQAMEEKKTREEKKRLKLADQVEARLPLSNEAAMALVEIKLGLENTFNNTSDKVDNVWDHVHAKYMALVASGQLLASDERDKQGLIARYAARPPSSLSSHVHRLATWRGDMRGEVVRVNAHMPIVATDRCR